jgi:SAM-dependent methyltransferase
MSQQSTAGSTDDLEQSEHRIDLTSSAQQLSSPSLNERLSEVLVCPRDKLPLSERPGLLLCGNGHRYSVVEGIPILLLAEVEQNHIEGSRSLLVAEAGVKAELPQFNVKEGEIDPFVKNAIGATNGSLYQHLVGNISEYPIPALRLPDGGGKLFLEIGCSWGRWCIAAARKGYRPVGIDPSLKGIRAARRIARQLGIEAEYLVADGRYLPFPNGVFDQAFSYSVLQHLPKADVRMSLQEVRRVLRAGGQCQAQIPNVLGVRCLYHQLRRGFRAAKEFEVRYWTRGELKSAFASIGPNCISVDGYFSLNAQVSDIRFFPRRYRALVRTSEFMRKLSRTFPPFGWIADSLYVTATRQ